MEGHKDVIINMAIESWRFARLFERLLTKLDAGEHKRYVGQLRWFIKKTEESLDQVGLQLVNVEGHLYDPEQVKVENWQVGETAVYHLKTNKEDRLISFHVAAQDSRSQNRFWLRTNGLIQFNKQDIELWRLLDKATLRLGSELRGFSFFSNTIPFPLPPFKPLPNRVILEKLGEEVIETPVGNLRSDHYFVFVRSPDGKLEPLLELWANPSVSPIGLVRARWRDASVDFVEVQRKTTQKIPPILLEEFGRDTPLEGSCARCHTEGVGGKDLKLEFINRLKGTSLNLTTALFHHRQAKIIKQNELLHLQFTEKSRRARKQALVRFSWKRGSFWVKPDAGGWIRISMDTIAHHSNITVQPNTGHLDLRIRR